MTWAAVILSVAAGILISISTKAVLLMLAAFFAAVVIVRIGWDRALIWSLLVPWQFLPVVNANILFNPWIWIAILRLLGKSEKQPRSHWSTNALVFTPALGYLGYGAVFGVEEPSLLYWTVPALALGISFAVRKPQPEIMRHAIFSVGIIFAVLAVIEFMTDLSFNLFLSNVPGVSDYLRGSRALGPAGNPLFSSAVLLVAFFAIPREIKGGNLFRVLFIVAIVMTGSKSAIIGLALGLPVAVYALGLKRTFGLVSSLVAGALIVVTSLPTALTALTERYSVFENLQESDPDRAFTTKFVLQNILERPMGGASIGHVLNEKQLKSPVLNGDIFGIESTWLALAADVGVGVLLVVVLSVGWRLLTAFRQWGSVALFALFVSLFFWNGLFGAWVIIPLWVVVAHSVPNIARENCLEVSRLVAVPVIGPAQGTR